MKAVRPLRIFGKGRTTYIWRQSLRINAFKVTRNLPYFGYGPLLCVTRGARGALAAPLALDSVTPSAFALAPFHASLVPHPRSALQLVVIQTVFLHGQWP